MKRSRPALACLVGLLVGASMALPAAVGGAEPADVASKRADLEDVQRRIKELESAIAATEASRSTAAEQLAESERAVSAANRRLRQLEADKAANERNLATQRAEQAAVEARIASRQEELADWLRRHYMHGGSDVAPLLSGGDPNQIARDVRYLEYVGRARLELIDALRNDLREQAQLVESISQRQASLVKLEAEQATQRAELRKVLAARATAVAKLSGQLQGQERAVAALRSNEEQLGRVVELLANQAAKREAERRDSATRSPARPPSGVETTRSEPSVGDVRRIASATPGGMAFAKLRGKMGFPVRGELVGKFGAPRAEGGTRWRGLFIRARSGDDVVAIASGEVVFSDWMRGYGNLIIVDHGDDYLSIYGNNDALLRVVGDRIDGGTPIASVGASGGARDSGLYFEIRHKGEPVDPMQWVRAR